ncbi:hypothetical protein JAAARDRAFT_28075 [Jaapia argillacea MUCL 33604]|uniref:Eukaryotic translation initiation factor 3 subunit M n=1 Tax=Jaapia argillacea MUCL 33604 TaxID=933084 RepID=A0A067QPA4_9AGAM|nr:hypothetical protein JAAARDRAFT_28075 [Jaapia argillacea MUCL 33604]
MSEADIVSVFAEGTFEEQIQELVNYLTRGRSDEERLAFIQPFQDALRTPEGGKPLGEDVERKRKIFAMVLAEVKGLGDGSEKEIEGFFNLLYAHLLTLYPVGSAETRTHVVTLLKTISLSPSGTPSKYRILSNLFNGIPRKSPLRLPVYNTLLEIAVSHDELDVLHISRSDVEKWTSEWDITPEEKSKFLKSIADAFAKAGQLETAYEYSLSYVRSLPSSSPDAQSAAVEAISTALRLPTIFDFDPLFKLDAVIASKSHELFSLLQVFLNGGLPEFNAWTESHPDALGKYGLEKAQLERKIRLLSLASLGFENIGRDLPYSKVAAALQVDLPDVEKWVIDVIRAGLLSGKLSQTSKTLHITRSTSRTFERAQWEALENRLLAWKTGLAGVLEVVAAAEQQNAPQVVPTAGAVDVSVQTATG